ncbi:MAG: MFS transporter [Candidatus Bathyarchaeia archaeon]
MALRYSPFMSLFTRYIDRGQESFEWGINGAVTSIGQALTAAVGGVLVEKYGFKTVFIVVGIFVLIGLIYPYMIYKEVGKSKTT